jgi:hypothetical protein
MAAVIVATRPPSTPSTSTRSDSKVAFEEVDQLRDLGSHLRLVQIELGVDATRSQAVGDPLKQTLEVIWAFTDAQHDAFRRA